MNKTRKKIKKNLPFIAIFILGFMIFSYPYVSQKFYEIKSNNDIVVFNKQAKKLGDKEINRRIELAKAYNRTLDPSKIGDPFDDLEKKGRAEYARMLEVHEMIGYVDIPKINVNLPIFAGTSEEVLQKGAGHLEGTSLPTGGKSTHTVITAHRGLPKAKMFRNLDVLKRGDIFYIHNIKEILAYRVIGTYTVRPDDFSKVLVEKGQDYATLLTCTPYMINSHRLLVRAERIPYKEAIDDGVANTPRLNPDFFQLFLLLIPILILEISIYLKENKKARIISRKVKKIEEKIKD